MFLDFQDEAVRLIGEIVVKNERGYRYDEARRRSNEGFADAAGELAGMSDSLLANDGESADHAENRPREAQ